MRALHFGAGNIGRGFIGKSLLDSNFNVIFSDVNIKLVEDINYYQEYTIKFIDKDKNSNVLVKNISAIHIDDVKIVKIIATVDIITTAVGFNILHNIAKIIIKGIIFKHTIKSNTFLNIIACENAMFASTVLKKIILKNLSSKYHAYFEEYIGFIDCCVDKIIPFQPIHLNNSLSLITEYFQEWIVNQNQFKGNIPKIFGMTLSNNLPFFIERKLFTLNTGHAIAAYLGLIKKYHTIYESISDKNIKIIVKGAMQESGNLLIKRFKLDAKNHMGYIDKIFSRFENPYIIDQLQRVARNPLQKLEYHGRLIKPFLGAIKNGLPNIFLTQGIASVLHYYDPNDIESIKMQDLIKEYGVKKALSIISRLNIDSVEICDIFNAYISLKAFM